MFKLVVLSALLVVAAAKPGAIIEAVSAPLLKTAIVHEPASIEVHEPTIAKVGDIVESVPTAVSHQSSTIVHSRANQITPIVAPAVRTYSTPIVKTYAAPIVESAPLLKTYAAGSIVESAPLLKTYAATPASAAIVQGPYLRSLDGSLASYGYAYAHGSPLLYSAPYGYAAGGAIYRSY
ncbi:cuticle protein 19.8 [Episyrphus balteatus]|uniref:cuticle protein 19.8 n=1 Tax=Episyrphus balteatus TaxID=286459 RepID=UPI00248513F4|nr:cuticle protein 19.8 [Episyrphus balteatus]